MIGLEESDGDKHQDEEDKHDQKIQNEAEGSTILYSKPNGNVDFKMAQLDTLSLSECTIKRKRRQLKQTGLIKRQPGSGRKS